MWSDIYQFWASGLLDRNPNPNPNPNPKEVKKGDVTTRICF